VTAKPGAPNGPSVTARPGATTSGAPVAAQPPAPRQADAAPRMPASVQRYLEFLRRVEFERRTYDARRINSMMHVLTQVLSNMMSEDNNQSPDRQIVASYARMAQEYAQGLMRFRSTAALRVGVPPECRALHDQYSVALRANADTILETARRLSAGDLGGLQQMRPTIGSDVNQEYVAAEEELERIFDRYNIPRRYRFNVGNGATGGSLFGF
jgi:hypothetical protein